MRALTALNRVGQAAQVGQEQVKGKPDEIPLNKIMRDPDNPRPPLHLRTPEEQQKQRELNANIKKRGVKSPISLRPHPKIPDTWIINHGHCRYDGAEDAGLPAIPYFIDPNFDSYDQVAENLHRADLSPWSIAEFIQRKLKAKQTKGQIAEGLGKENESYITEHLALVDAPKCLHQAYWNGVRSTRTLYDLRRAYEEFPEQVDAWCDAGPKVTRNTIQELLQVLRGERGEVEAGAEPRREQAPEVPEFRHDEKSDQADVGTGTQFPQAPTSPEFRHDEKVSSAGFLPTPTPPEFCQDEKKSAGSEPHRASKAPTYQLPRGRVLVVQYKGKIAKIAPNTTVKILVDGQNAPIEVPLSELVFTGTK